MILQRWQINRISFDAREEENVISEEEDFSR